MEESILYILATPIGNLQDLSNRARQTLEQADLIACEDTRRTGQLLKSLDITNKKLHSYHDHNEEEQSAKLIHLLQQQNLQMVLVSDAGTPCINDPGYRLVAAAHQHGIKVVPIPGPSAPVALLSASGLPIQRYSFVGFLPKPSQARLEEIKRWAFLETIVFFETAPRMSESLELIAQQYPDAVIAIGRELTKQFEEIKQLPIKESLTWAANHTHLQGEFCIALSLGSQELSHEELMELVETQAKQAIADGASVKDLVKRFQGCGVAKKELYRLMLEWTK